jgi:uncharacterized membrane protein
MEESLATAARYIGSVIDAMALVIITIGTIQAFVAGLWTVLFKQGSHEALRQVWLDYARWLVAGLTFQLAADLVHTTVAPTWDDVGRLAAIAAVRTVLNYFLERDMTEVRERSKSFREEVELR